MTPIKPEVAKLTTPTNGSNAALLAAELRALLAKATPGPWKAQCTQREGEDRGVDIIGLRLNEDGTPLFTPTNGIVAAALPFPTEIDEDDYSRVEANAALIVAAINALPTLLTAIEQGQGRVEAIQQRHARLYDALVSIAHVGENGIEAKNGKSCRAIARAALSQGEHDVAKEAEVA